MRLSDFILENVEPILKEWEAFARSIWLGTDTDPAELRDHAEGILRSIAADMKSAQSAAERAEKSKGHSDAGPKSASMMKASAIHALERVGSGLDMATVVSEYRALRASVIRLWRASEPKPDLHDLDDVTRFNEGIDQSISEAVRSYMERVSRSRQMFLAILGHDLRNPLNAMKLTGQILAHSGQLDAKLTDMASQIPTSAAAMGLLIDDLLDFSGSELTGLLPIAPGPMNLGDLCTQVVGEMRAAYPDRRIGFEQSGDVSGEWDAARLRQVISNLLGNAVLHGDDGRGSIKLRVSDQGATVMLAVHNQGRPIPESAIATLFDPFVRGADAKQHPGGMGLGLYITRAVVNAHGGAIDVTSSPETGTTFTVRLPRRRVAPVAKPGNERLPC
jgi:signal transduction histidine kinase